MKRHQSTCDLRKGNRLGVLKQAIGVGLLAAGLIASPAQAAPCDPSGPTKVMFVTAECEDPLYNASTFREDERVVEDVDGAPATVIRGAFTAPGTAPLKTIFTFPSRKFEGRFFQIVYPSIDQGERPELKVFAARHGAYSVSVRGGRAHRPEAAAAKLAMRYAREIYPDHSGRIYGYVWGGSGGSMLTISCIENTSGIWQGGLPFIIGIEGSLLYGGSAAALVDIATKGKADAVMDAMKPGGSGDPYAPLDPEERNTLREAIRLGYPIETLEVPPTGAYLINALGDNNKAADPTYVDDFWTKSGYSGATNPPPLLLQSKLDKTYAVTFRDDGSLALESAPDFAASRIGETGIEYWVIGADDKRLPGSLAGTLNGVTFTPGASDADRKNNAPLLAALRMGGKLRVNNLWYLAFVYLPRHSIPRVGQMYAFDQYRDAAGNPLYPQREYNSGQGDSGFQVGTSITGKVNTKVIVHVSGADMAAFPWNGVAYHDRVLAALGPKKFAKTVRIRINANSDHGSGGYNTFSSPEQHRLVAYGGSLNQSVLDIIDWVEKGQAPGPSTRFERYEDAQVRYPANANARGGIQPVIDLRVGGGKRIEVAAGQEVTFTAKMTVPRGTGTLTGYDWYLGGQPVSFEEATVLTTPVPSLRIQRSARFNTPGTYFVTLRASSHRKGRYEKPTSDTVAPTAVWNLDRVRVVVR